LEIFNCGKPKPPELNGGLGTEAENPALSGVARIPCAGANNIFAAPPTKTA